ncbi:hypothetical protein [Pontibacter chitinilyticus]|uniref:hypothetical protein n=1 Tax=Pontibacter chitinilyticus TaxID=2674989 RepID=UPI003218EE47
MYGYPKDKAAEVAVQAVQKYLQEHQTSLQRVVFICFDAENYGLYKSLLAK